MIFLIKTYAPNAVCDECGTLNPPVPEAELIERSGAYTVWRANILNLNDFIRDHRPDRITFPTTGDPPVIILNY